MTAAFASFWNLFEVTNTTTTPVPKRRSGPVLMGDILMARGFEPELLIRWREDRDIPDSE